MASVGRVASGGGYAAASRRLIRSDFVGRSFDVSHCEKSKNKSSHVTGRINSTGT